MKNFYKKIVVLFDKMTCHLLKCFLWTIFVGSKILEKYLDSYMIDRGYSDKFQKKYDEKQLFYMALSLPAGTKLNFINISSIYPILSKNHIYKIIEIAKNEIPFFQKVFEKNSVNSQ